MNFEPYYIVCLLSAGFGLIAIIISLIIIIIIERSRPHLHTIRHLLMCNTCIASIVYCLVQTNNYTFLIFLPWESSDTGCRWRGYFGYMSIAASIYSYLVQAVSRLFYSISSKRYAWLTTFKTHYILITIQWSLVLLVPLPAIITEDIYFRPGYLCWVPIQRTLHIVYTVFAYYFVSIVLIVSIYIYIYRRVKNARQNTGTALSVTNNKRDLEVLRNILLLLMTYITGGIPSIMFIVTSWEPFYLLGIVTFTFSITVEKMFTILLDRELRQTIKGIVFRGSRVVPFHHVTVTARTARDRTHT
jgi:hypothetical protein